jgi:hypothetical protein
VPRAATAMAAGFLLLIAMRAYHDFPALDRSGDRRPTAVIEGLTSGLEDRQAILLVDFNWQIANGLSYYASAVRPGLAHARMPDVLSFAPGLIRESLSGGRPVAFTADARAELLGAYGPRWPMREDRQGPSLRETVRALPSGTRYVLCVLKPTRDYALDREDIGLSLLILSPHTPVSLPPEDYVVVAGVAGEVPSLVAASNLPFVKQVQISGTPVEIRMDSWLAADTIRRMGFGQVVADREHTLIVERGVSFASFAGDGRALTTAYASSIFAPLERYLIDSRP